VHGENILSSPDVSEWYKMFLEVVKDDDYLAIQ
jgi:hypothetical protein